VNYYRKMRIQLATLFTILSVGVLSDQLINSDSFNSIWQGESQFNTTGCKVMQLIADGYLHGKRDAVFYLAQCGYDSTKAKGLKKERAKALSIQEYYAQRRDYTQGGLNIYEEIKEKSTFLRLLSGIRHFYVEQEKHGEGVEYLKRSRQAAEGTGVRSDIAMALADQGDVYLTKSRYKEAITQCLQALSMDEWGYNEKMIAPNKSLLNGENTKRLSHFERQHEDDKKEVAPQWEQENREFLAREELRRNKLIRNSLVAGFIMILLFGAVLINQGNKIKKGKKQNDDLLLNILPAEVAQELKAKGKTEAKQYHEATILFTDFKGFTSASEKLGAKELVAEINTCFKAFDHICEKHTIEKIKTIGDAYMAASGLGVQSAEEARKAAVNMVKAALDMQAFMIVRKEELEANNETGFKMRAGIHTGPVIAGIVGNKKFQYDIWGKTVKTASQMESSGDVGKVNISQTTFDLLKGEYNFAFESRGKQDVKGKGEIGMYFVAVLRDKEN
jgi:class 3 adenylate cyclase